MKLSKERSTKLFQAIDKPITDLRVELMGDKDTDIDASLFRLVFTIHSLVLRALNVEED